jgi:hypothetical protein
MTIVGTDKMDKKAGDRIGEGEGKCNVEKIREVLLILARKRTWA